MQSQAWHEISHTWSCPFRLQTAQECKLITETLAQVVLCKIASAQFGTMFAVGQMTYAHYAMEGLPADPAGFQPAGLSRCKPSLFCPRMQSTCPSHALAVALLNTCWSNGGQAEDVTAAGWYAASRFLLIRIFGHSTTYPQHSAEMQAWIAWCRPSFSGVASFLSKQGTLEPHEGQLRVLIAQRTGEVRNMLQLDELLSQCNAAQSLASSSQYSCRPFTFGGDLKRYFLLLLSCFACQSCSSTIAWTELFRVLKACLGKRQAHYNKSLKGMQEQCALLTHCTHVDLTVPLLLL